VSQIGCEEDLNHRKKTWMKQNRNWLGKWDTNLHDFPHTMEEIKRWVLEKFSTVMWTKQASKKRAYYVKEFNPTWKHDDKEYLSSSIKGITKILIALLSTSSHHLRCETGRLAVPKEDWEERACIFATKGW